MGSQGTKRVRGIGYQQHTVPASSLYNVTEIHSLIGRRPQRRCLKETEGEGNTGSREKNEWVGSGKENRAFLRREQKQGDDLNAL